MSRRKQTYYQYDPLKHEIKQVKLEDIAYLYDLTISNLRKYIHDARIIRGFNVAIYSHKPNINDKRQANERIMLDDELWRYDDELDVRISNYGRVKKKKGDVWQYKLPYDANRVLYLDVNNKKHRLMDVVYRVFRGTIPEGYCAYARTHLYNDVFASSLKLMKPKEYLKLKQHHRKAQMYVAVVNPQDNTDIYQLYRNTKEASENEFCGRETIKRWCRGNKVKNNRKYMYVKKDNAIQLLKEMDDEYEIKIT